MRIEDLIKREMRAQFTFGRGRVGKIVKMSKKKNSLKGNDALIQKIPLFQKYESISR